MQGSAPLVIPGVHIRPGLQKHRHNRRMLVPRGRVEGCLAHVIAVPGRSAGCKQQGGDRGIRIGGGMVEDGVAVVVRGTGISASFQAKSVGREVRCPSEDRRTPVLAAGRVGDFAVNVARQRISALTLEFRDRIDVDSEATVPVGSGQRVTPGAVQGRVVAQVTRVHFGPRLYQRDDHARVGIRARCQVQWRGADVVGRVRVRTRPHDNGNDLRVRGVLGRSVQGSRPRVVQGGEGVRARTDTCGDRVRRSRGEEAPRTPGLADGWEWVLAGFGWVLAGTRWVLGSRRGGCGEHQQDDQGEASHVCTSEPERPSELSCIPYTLTSEDDNP